MTGFHKFLSAHPNPDMPGVLDIDPQDLWNNRQKVAIIDVRRSDEYTGELGHIQNAQLIVLDTLPDHLDQIPKDKTVVFVCRSGGRSSRATAWAQSEGFENVYNLKGGMLLWQQSKLEAVRN